MMGDPGLTLLTHGLARGSPLGGPSLAHRWPEGVDI